MERCLAGGSFESCGHYRKVGIRRALEVVTLGGRHPRGQKSMLALDASIAEGGLRGWSAPAARWSRWMVEALALGLREGVV
jgi:hypothetical protein